MNNITQPDSAPRPSTRLIESDDACELTASSHQEFAGSQVLKHNNTFLLVDRFGTAGVPDENEQGLYNIGTRHLSRWDFRVGGEIPQLLSSAVKVDNSLMAVQMTNPDLKSRSGTVVPHGSLHFFRSLIVRDGTLHEQLQITNYARQSIEADLEYHYDADFKDIFEIRGAKRNRRGDLLPVSVNGHYVSISYRGLDERIRKTEVTFNLQPQILRPDHSLFRISVQPGQVQVIDVAVRCVSQSFAPPVRSHAQAEQLVDREAELRLQSRTRITTSNERFNQWIDRSYADLTMLSTETVDGLFPHAGVPWFAAPFGRDSIITALETISFAPELSRGTLRFLADTQATEVDTRFEAEPGKIIHEMRKGEMAELGETPFKQYYGTVDATPLFIMLAGEYYRRTRDFDFLESIWENIKAAVRWIDDFGDQDGDGFIEYASHNRQGLVHQCWKDSNNSVFHADGREAQMPIAISEVQGYVYAAKLAAAGLADAMREQSWGQQLRIQAAELRARFHDAFWVERLGTYALALDGMKRRCEVRNSNAGHLLYTGIVEPEYAKRVCATLIDSTSFNGWGLRTISSGEARYNPMSYHNGSVWPHDTALAVAGMSRYDELEDAMPIIEGLFAASQFNELYRLPELFCGFDRISGHGPTLYPVACSPQAWAAGAVFLLLQSMMRLSFSPDKPQIRFNDPDLPSFLSWVRVENLQVAGGSVDLVLRRHPRDVGLSVERKDGDIEIVVLA